MRGEVRENKGDGKKWDDRFVKRPVEVKRNWTYTLCKAEGYSERVGKGGRGFRTADNPAFILEP